MCPVLVMISIYRIHLILSNAITKFKQENTRLVQSTFYGESAWEGVPFSDIYRLHGDMPFSFLRMGTISQTPCQCPDLMKTQCGLQEVTVSRMVPSEQALRKQTETALFQAPLPQLQALWTAVGWWKWITQKIYEPLTGSSVVLRDRVSEREIHQVH